MGKMHNWPEATDSQGPEMSQVRMSIGFGNIINCKFALQKNNIN